jgi:hypothetical protein
MGKSRLEQLVTRFDSGDIDYDSLTEVDLDLPCRVSIDHELFDEVSRLAREKKTTVEKIINSILKKSLLKAA